MNNKEILLEMREITKSYPGVRALDKVSFQLRRGEVRALIGENGAGKSTLMRILAGIEPMTEGKIFLEGREMNFRVPSDALAVGIAMMHQEIKLLPNFTIDENIWIGREKNFSKLGVVDKKERRQKTVELLEKMQIQLDPDALVAKLSVAQMQLVEICRAVSYDAKIIIMDEPTSALAEAEIKQLFDVVRFLASEGVSIIFISHKIEELFTICETVTVMRDGKYVGDYSCDEITQAELVALMVNRSVDNIYPKKKVKIGEELLAVKNISSPNGTKNVSFSCRSGEILGISGLMGSGRTEIMKCIFGIDPISSGSIEVRGKPLKHGHKPKDAVENKIGMVTEDRRLQGCIAPFTVEKNISVASLSKIAPRGIIKAKIEDKETDKQISQLRVKTPTKQQSIMLLSGGNQQKVIVGRWLMANPDILILDEPTRGIDVGAKKEIYEIIGTLVERGMAVIMVSSELPELMGVSDRILVVRDGQIAGKFDTGNVTQVELANAAFGIIN